MPVETKEKIARESTVEWRIAVPKTLSKPHPIVRAWLRLDRHRWRDGSERRRLRILSALFEALEKRGNQVTVSPQNPYDVALTVEGEKIEFSLAQRQKQITGNLTAEELRSPLNAALGIKSRTVLRPTNTLVFKIHSWIGTGVRRQWRDTTRKLLEEQLNSIVTGLFSGAAMINRHRMEREEEERRLLAERIEREEQEEARRKESQKLQGLLQRVARWLQAADIRAYVSAVQAAAGMGRAGINPERLDTWASWALMHADKMDPIAAGDPLVES